MPLGWVAGAAALVSAGTAAYGAYESSENAGTARDIAGQQFDEQQQYNQMLMNLINDPSSITSTPGYTFQFNQGADAVAREMGASGMLGSGNEAIALTQYGQNFASSALTQQEQLLASLTGLQGNNSSNSSLLNSSSNSNQQAFNQTGSLLASLGYLYNNPNSGNQITTAASYGGQSGTIPSSGGYLFSYGNN